MTIARVAVSARRFTEGNPRDAALLRSYLDAFIAAGLVALFLVTFVLAPFYIPSVSMVPTLQITDVVLVDEIAYRLHPPAHDDIALFTPPIPAGGTQYVKRVIGVPGDRIRITGGVVYRNGTPLREPYENQPPNYTLAIRDYGIYVNGTRLDPRVANVPPRANWQAPDRIPDDCYFVLGDNRNYSDDSHVWGFAQRAGAFAAGPLAREKTRAAFYGRAFLLLWPLRRMHLLGH
ncbi:MAG: signal peptidase I [Candidatus Eremiobacteraeota bacterium]|nr:signal peptidase I [Candidatus Eremiobacteraeota bacterium]